ncbi:MAG: histidine kinase [Zoogloea sp.]|nr:histidine kinase [Zoogloea sp.]
MAPVDRREPVSCPDQDRLAILSECHESTFPGYTVISCSWLPVLTGDTLEQFLASAAAGGEPFHVLALLPESGADKVALLQAGCRAHGVRLGGALFPQLVMDETLYDSGAILLRVQGAPPPMLFADLGSTRAVEPTAHALAAQVDAALGEDREAALFCIFDALVPNIGTHLDAWYLQMADRVSYFGVNAGNERFSPAPCLFDGERFIGDGVLVQLLPDHPGAVLDHGYPVPEHLIAATSAEGNRIVQIDWRPALEVYSELMQSQYGVSIDRESFYRDAVHFPFGIVRADGEVLVRIPVALDEAGGIVCVGEIPPNSVLTLLDARAAGASAPATLAAQLTASGWRMAGEDLILFYCAGRRMHKGAAVSDELSQVRRLSGAAHLFGALSLGEIGGAKSGGYPLFHNATLVGVPCRRP